MTGGTDAPGVDALLDALRDGDESALGPLLEAVQPQVYRFGMRMCAHPEDAEDVLQETLLTLARRLREFRGDSALSTYAYTIARSHCIKKRRKSKFAPAELDEMNTVEDALPADAKTPHAELAAKESWEQVAEAISRLDPDYREVLVLRDIEGLSAKEVSEVVGASVSAVKSRLHRARKALRDLLGTPGAHPGCPDIVEMFSRNLEGELDAEICKSMEQHLAGCSRCSAVCDAVRADLRLCQMASDDAVPTPIQARIKAAIRKLELSDASS